MSEKYRERGRELDGGVKKLEGGITILGEQQVNEEEGTKEIPNDA